VPRAEPNFKKNTSLIMFLQYFIGNNLSKYVWVREGLYDTFCIVVKNVANLCPDPESALRHTDK
jgi:hypothetical protein